MSSQDGSKERIAACECGSLKITVRGDPVHHHGCTCTKCQRVSGSVMTVSAWYRNDQMVRIEGEAKTRYPGDTPDPALEIIFCPTCGGGGYWRSGDYLPGTFGINVGHFADPDFPPPGHIHWWANRPAWLAAPEGVELCDGNDGPELVLVQPFDNHKVRIRRTLPEHS